MKVHERSQQANMGGEGHKMVTRKQKAESSKGNESEQSPKKARNGSSKRDGKSDQTAIAKEFEDFCNTVGEQLSVSQMREILESNGQNASGSATSIMNRAQDLLFFGVLDKCPVCSSNNLELVCGKRYACKGFYSEWSSCTYRTTYPPRKEESIKLPDSVLKSSVADMLKKYQDQKQRQPQVSGVNPFAGMLISLSGRLSRTHQEWRKMIEEHGGKVSNSVIGVACLVTSAVERERGGSSKHAEAIERGIPVVREEWLLDSMEKQEAQPLEAYDVMSDLAVDGKGISWDKQDPSEEALESLSAELKVYGKQGVHKDTKLGDEGAKILEKDGILYNCAFSLCDLGRGLKDYCITQLITVPKRNLVLYSKKSRMGDDPNADERLEEWDNLDAAIKEFVGLFEEITGNEFEPWEREKKIEKKRLSYFPIDMDVGVDVRHGGLGLRQLGVAAMHCKLESRVANFMKVLCSQEIYRYALMEMGLDVPHFPMGMLTDVHLSRCEETLLQWVEAVKSTKETGQQAAAVWSDYSQRWFNLMPSMRPFIFRGIQELADNGAAAFETVRDINVASRVIGDMSGSTLDDSLSHRYNKLGCSVSALEKDSGEYEMISKYLEKTYEPVKFGDIEYDVSIDNIFAVQPNVGPSIEDMKKLPNKLLLWCGTRSSNLLRHLQKGFLPAVCSLAIPGYMFGKAIVCSDAAAEAARYGFTAVDRPEGFLVLAVASLGDQITEIKSTPEDTKSLEDKKIGVKGLGQKKTDESEHFLWRDDIRVPSGRLIPSEYKDSPLEYNAYAVYDPKQTSIRFLVGVKYFEKGVEMEEVER